MGNRLKLKLNQVSEHSIINLHRPRPAIEWDSFADSLSEAESLARSEVNYTHSPSQIIIQITEPGDKSVQPQVNVYTVNEAFAKVEIFEIDAATEFLWALAAVVGCFSMVLIPSFTVYFAARAKERKNEEKLRLINEDSSSE